MTIAEALRKESEAFLLQRQTEETRQIKKNCMILISKGYFAGDNYDEIISKHGSAEAAPEVS